MRLRLPTVLLLLTAVLLAGCGSDSSGSRPDEDARLTLDFTPNAVHAGIELAVQRGFDEAEGVHLQVAAPSQTTDSVSLLLSGKTQFAILDLHDLAIAREKKRDLVAVMAIVQDPLASVIAQPDVPRPRDLVGKRVGVTGAPSDDAVLDSIVRGDGGDPAKVKRATIGFEAVTALLSKKVAAATAFWNAEGVAIKKKRPGTKVFRVDDFGAPAYPELVLAVTRQTLQDDPDLVRATITALQRGYREAIADPASAVQAIMQAAPGSDPSETSAELAAVSPAFQADDGSIGTFDTAKLERWATWEQKFGIVKEKPEVVETFDGRFAREATKQTKQDDGS